MQNQITIDQIRQATQENFESYYYSREDFANAEPFVRDNFALDMYGYSTYLRSADEIFDMSDIKKVYEAAKVVFAQHPDQVMWFDPACYYLSPVSSPWCDGCKTPEMWAIAYGRRMLEDDEAAITQSDHSTIQEVLDFLNEMHTTVGIPEEVLWENIAYICYDNEELIAKIKEIIG